MFFKTRTITFNLKPTSIDEASAWFVDCQSYAGVDKKERLRARLLLEEALLNLADHYGSGQEVSAFFERRFGRFRLRLVIVGDRYNPLKRDDEGQGEWSVSIFDALGMNAQYSYNMGANVLRMPLVHSLGNPVLKMALAILVGAFVGMAGSLCIPITYQDAIVSMVLEPISTLWVRLLQTFSAPIVFFMALNASIGTKRISEYGGSRFVTVMRYFLVSVIIVLFAMVCTWFVFPVEVKAFTANRETISSAIDAVFHIVPSNMLEPFQTANTPQLLLLAIVSGYILGSMGEEVSGLKSLVHQANVLGLTIARQTCVIAPYMVGLLLCLRIWSRESGMLEHIWSPLVLSVAICVVVFVVVLAIVAIRLRVNPLLVMIKLKGAFVETAKRGSLDFASVDSLASDCKNLLGIDFEFASAALPQGLVLYMPTSAVGIWVFVVFAAQMQSLSIDQLWILAAAIMAVVLAVATPPVTGANLLAFVVAFAYLGISSDAILDVMVFDVVLSALCIPVDQALLQLETVLQAKHLGFLKEETLRAPMENA